MTFSSPMAAIAAGYSIQDYDPTEEVVPDYELMTKLSSPPAVYGRHTGTERIEGGGVAQATQAAPDATYMVKYFVV